MEEVPLWGGRGSWDNLQTKAVGSGNEAVGFENEAVGFENEAVNSRNEAVNSRNEAVRFSHFNGFNCVLYGV